MTVPSITTKTWTGSASERFACSDMNRVLSNCNVLADYIRIGTRAYRTYTAESQLMYDDINMMEEDVGYMSDLYGLGLQTDRLWSEGHPASYKDFDRWERNLERIREAIRSGESSGRFVYTAVFDTSCERMTDLRWRIEDASFAVVASGVEPRRRLSALLQGGAEYTLYADQYDGDTELGGIEASAHRSDEYYVCDVTVSCDLFMAEVHVNDVVASASGKSVTLPIVRGPPVSVRASSPISSPRYTGLSTSPMWTGSTETVSVDLSEEARTVSLTMARKGVEVFIPGPASGVLGVPVDAKFEIYAISGGYCGGDKPSWTASHPEAPQGGDGGHFAPIPSKTMVAGSYAVSVGAGGTHSSEPGATTVTGPSGSVVNASGRGAGGGGGSAWYKDSSSAVKPKGSVGRPGSPPGSGGGGGGGGGGGSTKTADALVATFAGGSAGWRSGAGGSGGTAGSSGTIMSVGGVSMGYGGTSAVSWGGGGGGGGYGADGGSSDMGAGGGGGGALGGRGGGGLIAGNGEGGLGYGAGGGGCSARYPDGPGSICSVQGGGGGGGYGTVKLAQDGWNGEGGDGAPGCISITWKADV